MPFPPPAAFPCDPPVNRWGNPSPIICFGLYSMNGGGGCRYADRMVTW